MLGHNRYLHVLLLERLPSLKYKMQKNLRLTTIEESLKYLIYNLELHCTNHTDCTASSRNMEENNVIMYSVIFNIVLYLI